MSEQLKKRSENNPEFMWDLSDLFVDDGQWEEKLKECDGMIRTVSDWKGKLRGPSDVKAFLDQYWQIHSVFSNLMTYANLRYHEDMQNSAAQSMHARIFGKYVSFAEAASFAEPEILSLPDDTLRQMTEDPLLADYRYYLTNLLRSKKHVLSEKEESILAGLREVIEAPSQIAENLMNADLVFDPVKDAEGNEHELSNANFILMQNSTDRVLRKNAFMSFYKTYRQHVNTFAASLSSTVRALVTEAKMRHYDSDREMALDHEHIPVSVYDTLIETVHSRMPSMYRYLKLRKEMLGLDELHYYDLYTPLFHEASERYTFEEAEKLVKEAVRPMGEEYCSVFDRAFEEHWIDVYPNIGKMGGAYSSGTYDSRPYILLNYTGTLSDVSTIIHELGHSLHTWHTNHHQPVQYSSYTMFVAEVASTVNENLLAEHLLGNVTDPRQKMNVLNLILEGFKGTVYRQTMFAEFEREIHALAEKGEALNAEVFCSIYKKLIRLYFGDELVIDEEVRYEWARIPHFYYLFYVYVYATGYCSATALSQKILHEGNEAVTKYLEFLSMGGSADPLDELKHAGVDLTTPEPINQAIDQFDRILEEAEKTAALLK